MPRKINNDELDRKTIEEFKAAEKTPLVIVLDNVRSLNNIGSVFRTADAFLVEEIILCGITARPPHKDINKTALGATDSVQWSYVESTLDAVKSLQEKGYHVYAVEQAEGAIMLDKFIPAKDVKTAVVFGNEVKGVAQEVVDQCDGCIEIPQFGTKHSLNIAVSVGVVVWDVFSKAVS